MITFHWLVYAACSVSKRFISRKAGKGSIFPSFINLIPEMPCHLQILSCATAGHRVERDVAQNTFGQNKCVLSFILLCAQLLETDKIFKWCDISLTGKVWKGQLNCVLPTTKHIKISFRGYIQRIKKELCWITASPILASCQTESICSFLLQQASLLPSVTVEPKAWRERRGVARDWRCGLNRTIS